MGGRSRWIGGFVALALVLAGGAPAQEPGAGATRGQRFPAISSYEQAQANPDGSIDLYIGPKTPAGKERNWIETDSARGWTGIFRVYGPLEPFFDQTWKLDDLEPID